MPTPKRKRPERAPDGLIYFIRHSGTDIHKIGITLDWSRRAKQLEVGTKVQPVAVVRVQHPRKLERLLHARFSAQRLPQSEWFHLDAGQVEYVLAQLRSAEARFKELSQDAKAPPKPATRKPQPYRVTYRTASRSGRTTNLAHGGSSSVKPALRQDETSARIPPTSRDAPKTTWEASIVIAIVSTLMLPALSAIFIWLRVVDSSEGCLVLGAAMQSIIVAVWIKKWSGWGLGT